MHGFLRVSRRAAASSTLLRGPAVIARQPVRQFRSSRPTKHGDYEWQDPASPEDVVRFSVVGRDGKQHEVAGKVGDNVLYLMHRLRQSNDELALEGACEASLACSTCHVIVSPEHFEKLTEPEEEEEDMLDEATCLEATSRLGCQIILAKELDGMVIKLPAYARNFYVDGHVPEPH